MVKRRPPFIELQALCSALDLTCFEVRITVAELKGLEFQSTVAGNCSGIEMF